MAIVFRVVKQWGGFILEAEGACPGTLLFVGIKVHVNPLVSRLVLYFPGNDVLLCLDAERASQVNEKDVS